MRCGRNTGVTLCEGTYHKEKAESQEELDQYTCMTEAFTVEVNTGEQLGTLVNANTISSVIIRPDQGVTPPTCPDFELIAYDEPYCQGNSNVITVEELRTEIEL